MEAMESRANDGDGEWKEEDRTGRGSGGVVKHGFSQQLTFFLASQNGSGRVERRRGGEKWRRSVEA